MEWRPWRRSGSRRGRRTGRRCSASTTSRSPSASSARATSRLPRRTLSDSRLAGCGDRALRESLSPAPHARRAPAPRRRRQARGGGAGPPGAPVRPPGGPRPGPRGHPRRRRGARPLPPQVRQRRGPLAPAPSVLSYSQTEMRGWRAAASQLTVYLPAFGPSVRQGMRSGRRWTWRARRGSGSRGRSARSTRGRRTRGRW